MEQSFFKKNRELIADDVKNGIILLYSGPVKKISSQESYEFRVNKMFYYLTGINQPNVILLLYVKNALMDETLFIPKPDPGAKNWDGEQFEETHAAERSGISNIYYLDKLKPLTDAMIENNKDDTIWVNMVDRQHSDLRKEYDLSLTDGRMKCIHKLLSIRRNQKKALEIDKIKEAGRFAAAGMREMMRYAVPGIREYQLEAIHDYTMKSKGLKSGQYKTILASGKNATILHYLDNDCNVEAGDLVLVDMDVEVDYYHSDITRVFPASRTFTNRQREVYMEVLYAQKELIKALKPGMTYGEWNQLAKILLTSSCERLSLPKPLGYYYFHRAGHPIGLDTHDVGQWNDKTVFVEGMVMTVEPGLYIPEENIGIRIEDMVAITSDGAINLTDHLEKEIDDIEQLMTEGGDEFHV
ncbi:aminopeptidase P family protein [Oceanobacillus neutriphilus]|uniref:Xaa-Pro aminopeptidase n=1 Tax=Oceanobacillus neutriphilus TaxID=531815 RepID=A0ABQ2NPQ0_9BACI|nr:aminopeptidase P family protein [Oceanobacillus neutriphilus]GGP07797.1 Xaa-Pro aminopeptidase [Oceanobacillus neutriphilus]